MPRRRRGPPRARPAPGDRDRLLAEEVLYLHSLWRRGPPAPAPAPVPTQAPSSAARETQTTKRKRPSVAARKAKTIELKRLRREAAAAVEPKANGFEWPVAPSPPNSSPKGWPETAPPSSSTPTKPPPPPPSPGALAQREALRAAAKFLSNRASSSSDDGGSESEGEQDAAGFITGLFERDAALRGHYERRWEEGQFECLACAGGKRKAGRRFKGCVALVQHAGAAPTRYGRPRAHRALAAIVCRLLGWDIARLPSIVIDPRGTLGQALAAAATAGVQLAEDSDDTGEDNDYSGGEDEEEDAETGMEDSSTDGDEEADECRSSEESAEKEDVEKGVEDPNKSTDKDDEEAIELDNSEKSAGKEEMEEISPSNCNEISKNEVSHNDSVQEDNAGKGDSSDQGNNEEVHKQEVAEESSEQENTNDAFPPDSKGTCKKEEHSKEVAVQKEQKGL